MVTADSSLWRHIVELWTKMRSMEFWSVGDGDSVHFWEDCWVEPRLKLKEVVDVVPPTLAAARVNEMVNDLGYWKMEVLSQNFPVDVLRKITAILPPAPVQGLDRVCWAANPSAGC